MKAQLEFNYPEDIAALQMALNGDKAFFALKDVARCIRAYNKYDGNVETLIADITEIIYECLNTYGDEIC